MQELIHPGVILNQETKGFCLKNAPGSLFSFKTTLKNVPYGFSEGLGKDSVPVPPPVRNMSIHAICIDFSLSHVSLCSLPYIWINKYIKSWVA